MRMNGFTCVLLFFLVCVFFLLFQKNPLLAIGLLVIVVGFKFARTTINSMASVARELHTINQHLAYLSNITEILDKVATQLTTEAEKEETPESPLHSDAMPQELSEMDI